MQHKIEQVFPFYLTFYILLMVQKWSVGEKLAASRRLIVLHPKQNIEN